MNNVQIKILLDIFERGYSQLFEADQSKMTPAQIQKDIEKRNRAQTIGIEIEFYADMGPDKVSSYIVDTLGFVRGNGDLMWNAEDDASLTANDIEETHNSLNLRLQDENPVDVVLDMFDLDEVYGVTERYMLSNTTIFKDFKAVLTELDQENSKAEADASYEKIPSEQIISLGDYDNEDTIRLLINNGVRKLVDIAQNDKLKISIIRSLADDELYSQYLKSTFRDVDGIYDEYNESSVYGKEAVEINFNGPRKLSELNDIVDEVDQIMSDPEINAQTYYGVDQSGETGLHVHFGLAQNKVTNMDLLRLVINTEDRIDEIVELGGREIGKYQQSIVRYLRLLDNFIDRNSDVKNLELPDKKMFGTSFMHRSKKGTVEFRWAHSSITEDKTKFRNYLELLIEIVNSSFTGSDSLEYKGVIIKEGFKGAGQREVPIVIAIRDGKVIKTGKMSNYAGDVKSRVEKYENKYSRGVRYIDSINEKIKEARETIRKIQNFFKETYNIELNSKDKILEFYNKLVKEKDSNENIENDYELVVGLWKAVTKLQEYNTKLKEATQETEAAREEYLGIIKKKKKIIEI